MVRGRFVAFTSSYCSIESESGRKEGIELLSWAESGLTAFRILLLQFKLTAPDKFVHYWLLDAFNYNVIVSWTTVSESDSVHECGYASVYESVEHVTTCVTWWQWLLLFFLTTRSLPCFAQSTHIWPFPKQPWVNNVVAWISWVQQQELCIGFVLLLLSLRLCNVFSNK